MIEFFKEFPVFGCVVIALALVLVVAVFSIIRSPRPNIGIDGLVALMRANKPLKMPPPKHAPRPQPSRRREDRGFDDSISFRDSE